MFNINSEDVSDLVAFAAFLDWLVDGYKAQKVPASGPSRPPGAAWQRTGTRESRAGGL